jgi:hypothetical protein
MIGRKRDISERDLTALADGSLPASRRARVERAVAGSDKLRADIVAQRRALAALGGAAEERAPNSLRARLELARIPRRRTRLRGRPAWATATAAVAALTATTVLALVGGPSPPTVASAATLAARPMLAPVGSPSLQSATLPWPSASGLPFPNWAHEFGFTAIGMRRDRLGGRVATTVLYAGGGQRVAYTIVSGRPLAAGTATRRTVSNGTRVQSFLLQQHAVVTWLRDGHTCVLSGSPALQSKLIRLATWTPAGEYFG